MSHWTERIEGTVLDAIKAGVSIYVGFGELHPARSMDGQSAHKPNLLPNWHTYLDEKTGTPKQPMGQPGIRFLRLVHKTRNLTGPEFQVYPTLPATDAGLGVPLVIPLGEGVQHTPPDEMDLRLQLEAHCLFKPVRIIGICRYRVFTVGHSAPVLEPIIIEIYNEAGSLVWSNPRLTLEGVIETALGSPMTRTNPTISAPTAVEVPVVPHPRPSVSATTAGRMDLGAMFDDLQAQGLDRDTLLETVARSTSVPLPIVTAAYGKHTRQAAREAVAEEWGKAITMAREYGLEGEDLVQAVAEMVHAKQDDIRDFIKSPAGGAPASAAKASRQRGPLATSGHVASALGAGTTPEPRKAAARPRVVKPADPGSSREEAMRISAMISNKRDEYQAKTLDILSKHEGPMPSLALREALGIPQPPGDSLEDRKVVGHAFLRNVIRPLLRAPAKIVQHGTLKATAYGLKN